MNFHASQALLSCPFLGSIEEKKDSCEVEWSFSILDVISQVSRPSDCYLWRIPQTNFCMRSEHRSSQLNSIQKCRPMSPIRTLTPSQYEAPSQLLVFLILRLEGTNVFMKISPAFRYHISMTRHSAGETQGTDFLLLHSSTEVEAIWFSFEDRVLF
jgi:hypothetical protein